MLDLVSKLDYLKLVSPPAKSISIATDNKQATASIFEKVDYIKKLNMRRKALKKALRKHKTS